MKSSLKEIEQIEKRIVETLKLFPPTLMRDESKYKEDFYKGTYSLTRFVPEDDRSLDVNHPGRLSFLIPEELMKAVEAFDSIHEYLLAVIAERGRSPISKQWAFAEDPIIKFKNSEDKQSSFHQEYNEFNEIPLGEVLATNQNMNEARIEAFVRRRTIWSLTRICAEEPTAFFNNEIFKMWLAKDCIATAKNFLFAIRIEPCVLQTDFGIEVLKNVSFWDKNNAYKLATALKPSRNKSPDFKTDSNNPLTIQILLVLLTFVPEINQITDPKLQQILISAKYLPKTANIEVFSKMRSQVFKKRPSSTVRQSE